MVVRSFLIPGDSNLLINAGEGALESAEAIDELGGVDALWLGHWHEALTGARAIAERFKAPVMVHEADRAMAEEKEVPVHETIDGPRRISVDLEAIPIPGHTEGSVAYLWNGPDARCLFTADSLYMKNGKLCSALLESSDREAILASLARLRDIEIDLLVPWVAEKGAAAATPYRTKEFRSDLDTVIGRIEAGGDG
jgi:glyoxylase-like metal-dependent hydrolase (beta-lactamase superfamily II)